MTIYNKLKNSIIDKIGSILERNEIIQETIYKYPDTNISSILPSDYCYNRINKGIKHYKHLFEYLGNGKYKILGENFKYTGNIYTKPKGEKIDIKIGQWINGQKEINEIL